MLGAGDGDPALLEIGVQITASASRRTIRSLLAS